MRQLKPVLCDHGIKMLLTHLSVGFVFLQRRKQDGQNQLRWSAPREKQYHTVGGVCDDKREEVVKVLWL